MLGASKARTVRRIVVPLMTGGILAGFLTSSVTAANVSATIMLQHNTSDAPLAYGIYLYMQSPAGRGPPCCAGDRRTCTYLPRRLFSHLGSGATRGNGANNESPVKPVKSAGIDICNVNVSYGTNRVLKDVNLSIAAGEFFAFLGPSGCGKTTLLRLIAGFNQASSGEVLLGNEDIARLPPWKRDVGMVFQSYALWPHMTVARNVAFGLEERRCRAGGDRAEGRRRRWIR